MNKNVTPSGRRADEADDEIEIFDEEVATVEHGQPWVVICADDDPSAHRSTKFALDGELIEGRPVSLMSAYSAKEAIELVERTPDAAALLLDVVMETPTAGLDAIEQIRERLGRRALRIIVRSGAPGHLGELETVKKFDITDWRPKAELNQARLMSAITLAVRAYKEIMSLARREEGLELALEFLERLAKDPGSESLMEDILSALSKQLGQPVRALWGCGNQSCALGGKEEVLDPEWAKSQCGPGCGRLTQESFEQAKKRLCQGNDGVELDPVKVGARELRALLWSPKGAIELEDPQAMALSRALRAALAGQEKARQERDAMLIDPGTGLLSRQGFLERAAEEVEAASEPMAMYLVDLAGFRRVNAALGHAAGDEILRQAASRVESCAQGYPCGRIASDAFATLMPARLYEPERMDAAFAEPMRTEVFPVQIRPRVAAAPARKGEESSLWLTRAAVAMDEAKGGALTGGAPRWFDPGLENHALLSMSMSQKIFDALKTRKGLFMAFQPQIRLADEKVVGVEALIRWKQEDGKMVPPDVFIPIAEGAGLAMGVSEFALEQSLMMMVEAKKKGIELGAVSVNISATEFEPGDLKARVEKHLALSGAHPSWLMLEVTETAAAKDPERMMSMLEQIRAIGCKVAIDDFGSGYSSLGQLARLPIDELKIDKSFVNAIGESSPLSGIPNMIVQLGNNLGMEVVAEGVETKTQADLLRQMGAHTAQGWLYAKAMPKEELLAWVKAWDDKR